MKGSHKGTLKMFTGCMWSGKSDRLILDAEEAKKDGLRIAAFKPAHDTRSGPFIQSRTGRSMPAIVAERASEIAVRPMHGIDIVYLDEVQFYDEDLVSTVLTLLNDLRVNVVASGLDTCFAGRPFRYVPHLLALADEVVKLHARCARCHNPATRSQLLVAPPPSDCLVDPELVGGAGKYEARCRDCHTAPPPA